MAFFANLSIGKKLSVGFGALLGFMAISNIQGIYSIEVVHDSVTEIGDRNAPAMDAANQLATTLLKGQSVMQEYDSRTSVLSSQLASGELATLKGSFAETNAQFDQFAERLVEADGRSATMVRLVKEADTIHNTRFQPLADDLMLLGAERMNVMQDRDEQMVRMEQVYGAGIEQADNAETAVKAWVRDLRNEAVFPQDFNNLLLNVVPFVDATMELKISLLKARVAIEEIVQQSAMTAITPLIEEYKASNAHFDELIQAVLAGGNVDGDIIPTLSHSEAREFVEALDAQHDEFQGAADAIIDHQRKLLSLTAEATDTREKLFATEAEVAGIVENIKGLTGQSMINAKATAQAGYDTALYTQLAIGVVAIAAGILIGMVISRSVTVPLSRAVHSANRLAAGDLTVRVDQTSSDETGQLITALNDTSGRLHDMISAIAAASVQMVGSTNEVATITQKTASSIEDQSSDLQQASVAMNEMSVTVREVAQHATDAAKATQQADIESKSGRSLVSNVNESIQSLAKQIELTRETIHKLGAETDNVGSILTVITGIAEQTNLLALNAAIEAARAGEQGRGFAVVADEVRTLASRTQDSTNTISKMITTLKSEAQRSIDFMNEGHAQAGNAVDLSNQAASSLEEIEKAVGVITEMNIQIASSAEEQSAVAEEVNATVHRINDRGAETFAGAQQVAVATEELTQLSENLKGLVSQFKIA